MKFDIKDYQGKVYNRLTVLSDEGVTGVSQSRWCMAVCSCGKTIVVRLANIVSNKTKSCGCLRSEISTINGSKRIIHGLRWHPLHNVWSSMKGRCYCVTTPNYPNYGGSGVEVCDEWKNDFVPFYNWAIANGWKNGLQLDKDKLSPFITGKLYSPEFCCFLTPKENTQYRRNSKLLEYNGDTKHLNEWADQFKIRSGTILCRLNRGWSIQNAIGTPVQFKTINK
jgi:hypothetical protein